MLTTNWFKSRKIIDQLMNDGYQDEFIPTHQLGPDYIIPSDKYYAIGPEDTVKLRIASTGINAMKPKSLVTMFQYRVNNSGEMPALSVKRNDVWQLWTYNQFWQDINIIAKAFLKLGLQRYHTVALLGFNSPEWMIAFWAAICAGGIGTGIYVTNSAEACKYILQHSQTNIAVVENAQQLQKILLYRDQLPDLRAIIQYTGKPAHEDVFSWDDVLELGKTVNDDHLQSRIKSLAANQAATIMYTSGTTGNSKASMMSHDALVYNVEFIKDLIKFEENDETLVSFLPLNHSAAQMIDVFVAVDIGAHVYFAKPDALKGSLPETLLEARPTFMLAVPRVWEKLKESLENVISNTNIIKKATIRLAMNNAYKYSQNIMKGHTTKPCYYKMVESIIKELQATLGLDKVKNFISGGAPINEETIKFFLHMNIFLCEAFGLTETGCLIRNSIDEFRIGSIGKASKNNEVQLQHANQDGGEICFRSRSIFMGYMFDEEKTLEVYDADQWLHTEDIGKFDEDGFLHVTGRIKELLITAGGENIAPILIEDNVKAELPLVSQAVAIGNRRKYLTMLLTIKTDLDKDTMLPTDNLTPLTILWCRTLNSNVQTLQELCQDDKILQAIQVGINRANKKAISRACCIQKWRILPRDFTMKEDEIGPTMKLKRHVICEHFNDIIESMYV